ncbi:MAG: hypothetical protein ABA06_01030 [Parcubacteria bacterium C7867-001]|nr:MAG: hypothetical protein ABA06_01030 [Parcubacteria bacterium C7867-001]
MDGQKATRLMLGLAPDGPRLSTEEIQELCRKADERFAALTEEDQIFSLLAGKISGAYGLSDFDSKITKEEIAEYTLKIQMGPKFAERVLKDPITRKKLGLEPN